MTQSSSSLRQLGTRVDVAAVRRQLRRTKVRAFFRTLCNPCRWWLFFGDYD